MYLLGHPKLLPLGNEQILNLVQPFLLKMSFPSSSSTVKEKSSSPVTPLTLSVVYALKCRRRPFKRLLDGVTVSTPTLVLSIPSKNTKNVEGLKEFPMSPKQTGSEEFTWKNHGLRDTNSEEDKLQRSTDEINYFTLDKVHYSQLSNICPYVSLLLLCKRVFSY